MINIPSCSFILQLLIIGCLYVEETYNPILSLPYEHSKTLILIEIEMTIHQC